jgi:hypothetical protein
MKPHAGRPLALADASDDDLDDLELRDLFSVAASAKRDDFVPDLDDVLARAERRPLEKRERTFASRNGAFVSTVSAFAAAACLWLSAGAGYATSSASEAEATLDGPGICAESDVDPNACMIPASLVRAPRVRTRTRDVSSDDFRVCDARLVTCVP